jgi:hypothetical protein
MLDAMPTGEREREPLPFLGSEQVVHIDRMHGLSAPVIATSAAHWLPASGETWEGDSCQAFPPALGFKRPMANAARKL